MIRFLLKTVCFLLLLMALDWTFSKHLQTHRPTDYRVFIDSKRAFFIHEKKYDILIVGDSRIGDGVDTRTIEADCGFTAFNLGMRRASPYEWYYTLVHALSTNIELPQLVLIGTNPNMFNKRCSVGYYTPLLIDDPLLRIEMFANSTEGLVAGTFFRSIREQHLVPKDPHGFPDFHALVFGKSHPVRRHVVSTYNGHLEFHDERDDHWEETDERARLWGRPRASQIDYFEKLLVLLQEHGITPIVVNTPTWHEVLQRQIEHKPQFAVFDELLNDICLRRGVAIFNAQHIILHDSLERSDFYDTIHLNYSGAVKFTQALCEYLASRE